MVRERNYWLRLSWLVFAVATVWFLVNLAHPVGPAALLWITTPLCGIVGTGAFWHTSRNPALPVAARRFWRRLTPVATLVGIGQTAQALSSLRSPGDGQDLGLGGVVLACSAGAIVIIIYALHRLPTGGRDRGDTLQVSLDAGTVMLATAVFIWHFGTRQQIGDATGPALAGALGIIVLGGFVVFTIMKVLLYSAYAVIDGTGLRLLALAVLTGCLEPMLQPALSGYDGRLYITQVGLPLIYLFAAEAAARQAPASIGDRRDTGRRRRSFSFFPYAAVAGVDGLLIWVACFDLADIVMVAAAAVALTAFVVMRQVLSLVANGKLVRQLDHSANHDPLTGLPNRSYYNQRLHQALAAPDDRPVTLALIDLDDFKMVNDTLGHEIGDALLVEVAGRLRDCVRAGDTVARLGGDEFVAILEHHDTAPAIERMLAAFVAPVGDLPVRASIGVAEGRPGSDPSVLLRQADMAMYAAKNLPGTAAVHYDEHTATEFLTNAKAR